MSETTIKVKQIVQYAGHSLSSNGSVNFNLKARYGELVNTIKLMQMLNNDIKVGAKIQDQKPITLGYFRLKQIVVEGDGESKIKFNGVADQIEMDNLNGLPLNDSDANEFTLLCVAEVEEDGD